MAGKVQRLLNTSELYSTLVNIRSYTPPLCTPEYMFDLTSCSDRIYACVFTSTSPACFVHIGDIMSICATICEPNCVFKSDSTVCVCMCDVCVSVRDVCHRV